MKKKLVIFIGSVVALCSVVAVVALTRSRSAIASPEIDMLFEITEPMNLSDEQLRELVWQNWHGNSIIPDFHEFDDFGVELLQEGDDWNGITLTSHENFHSTYPSANSVDEAYESARRFREDATIEFIGENDFYYSFRVAGEVPGAYELGLLTNEDLNDILYYHQHYYGNIGFEDYWMY